VKGSLAVHTGAYSPSACGAFNSASRGGTPHQGESKQTTLTSRLAAATAGETTVRQHRGEGRQASHDRHDVTAAIESDAAHAVKLGRGVYTYAVYPWQIGSSTNFKSKMFLAHYFLYMICVHTYIVIYCLMITFLAITHWYCNWVLLFFLLLLLLLLHIMHGGAMVDVAAHDDFETCICACWLCC
jgi:hypothetical protein